MRKSQFSDLPEERGANVSVLALYFNEDAASQWQALYELETFSIRKVEKKQKPSSLLGSSWC